MQCEIRLSTAPVRYFGVTILNQWFLGDEINNDNAAFHNGDQDALGQIRIGCLAHFEECTAKSVHLMNVGQELEFGIFRRNSRELVQVFENLLFRRIGLELEREGK